MRQIPHPEDLFDRQQEWAELSAFVTDPTPGLRIGIVYGRRRQGKSYLLRRLAVATGGFYYQALEHEPAQARADLGERLGSHLGVGRLALADWPEAISALRGLAPRRSGLLGDALVGSSLMGGGSNVNGPAVAVLDEFPYLLERSPELPSLLQRAVDPSREQNWPAVRLILCGSAISVMADLLEGKGPLRGRGHTNLVMRPFDHLDARRFWNISDPRLAFRMNATLGGTPAYRDLVPSIPKSLRGFDTWVVNDVLSPASALFHEDEWLLGEEHGMENRALYTSILAAVAAGSSTQTSITRLLGRSQQSLLRPLEGLVKAGFLAKHDDALRQRRPVYRIADPIIRFHQVVRHPRMALFEERRGVEAWADARSSFESLVLGPHFEHLAREHVRRVGNMLFGVPIFTAGATVVNDREGRAQHELDIVALSAGTGAQHRVVEAIGEAKLRKLGVSDLTRLELICSKLDGAERARLVLASASGFTDALVVQANDRTDVHLIGLEDIYGG